MKTLYFTVILAVASSASPYFGQDANNGLIHSPWWRPNSPPMDWPGLAPAPPKDDSDEDDIHFPPGGPVPPWGRRPSGGDMHSYAVIACMRNCPVLPGYNPVCGSNNITYATRERLDCARMCGVSVTLKKLSSCSATRSPEDIMEDCISACPVPPVYRPVCGSDNITYANIERLECARSCGRDVILSRSVSCSIPVDPIIPSGRVPGEEGGDGPSTTQISACIQHCPTSPEVNFVCGTDGVTYNNVRALICAQFCGKNVILCTFGPCAPKPTTTLKPVVPITQPAPPVPVTKPPTTQECISRCFYHTVSLQFKPVCGSDGVTYYNVESLQCKVMCGIDISVQTLSPCGTPVQTTPAPRITSTTPVTPAPPVTSTTPVTPTPRVTSVSPVTPATPVSPVTHPGLPLPTPGNSFLTCIDQCTTAQEHKPVCGTNGVTYDNLPKLQCAKRCGLYVDVKYLASCSTGPSVTNNGQMTGGSFKTTVTTTPSSGEIYDWDAPVGSKS